MVRLAIVRALAGDDINTEKRVARQNNVWTCTHRPQPILNRYAGQVHLPSARPPAARLRAKCETQIRLHAPCGVVRVTVTTILEGDRPRSDATRPVTFISVSSFVSAQDVMVDRPDADRWAALRATGGSQVGMDIVYGGALYAFADVRDLRFAGLIGHVYRLWEFDEATAVVKRPLGGRHELVKHPSERCLEYLDGVIVTDEERVGLCFFAEQEVDRSPTGSVVSARVALEVAGRDGDVPLWLHSPMSVGSEDGFTCTVVDDDALCMYIPLQATRGGRLSAAGGLILPVSPGFYSVGLATHHINPKTSRRILEHFASRQFPRRAITRAWALAKSESGGMPAPEALGCQCARTVM